jgi:hypothetical protein
MKIKFRVNDFLEQSERPKEHRRYDWIVLA